MGGALSLCLGMALIMVVELGELLVDLIFNVWNYTNGRDITKERKQARHVLLPA